MSPMTWKGESFIGSLAAISRNRSPCASVLWSLPELARKSARRVTLIVFEISTGAKVNVPLLTVEPEPAPAAVCASAGAGASRARDGWKGEGA